MSEQPGWSSGVQWAVWAILMSVVMGWLAGTRNRPRSPAEANSLRHPASTLLIGLVCTGFFAGIAVLSALYPGRNGSPFVSLLFVTFAALGIPILLDYRNARHTLTPDGPVTCRASGAETMGRPCLSRWINVLRSIPTALVLGMTPALASAQRQAMPDDFPGITRCEGGQAITSIRAGDSLLRAQLEAHEAVHRSQAAAFPTCEDFVAGLTSARHIIDVELPAYCAQWRVAVGQGAEPVETRREFAWRIAAQSGAMENRLQVVQRFERECELVPAG